MADLTVTAAEVSPVFADEAEIYSARQVSGISRGDSVYEAGASGVAQSNAGAAGTARFHGLIVSTSAGVFSLMKRGHVEGFDLSGMAPGDLVYLSNTAGKLADAAGTVSVVVGRVVALTDSGVWTKVLYIDADWRS